MTTIIPNNGFQSRTADFAAAPACGPGAEPTSLLEAVQAAVQKINECSLWRLPRSASLVFQPRMMLALLTYCYARQIYGSAEVQRRLSQDAEYREISHQEFPSAREFREFRERNRSVIQKCLTAALLYLVAQKVAAGFVTKANEAYIAEEARRRVIMAACTDSMESLEAAWPATTACCRAQNH